MVIFSNGALNVLLNFTFSHDEFVRLELLCSLTDLAVH